MTTGPYPAELGFERWRDAGGIYERQFGNGLVAVVNFLPKIGWGFMLLITGEAIRAKYCWEWAAQDAMEAAIDCAERAQSIMDESNRLIKDIELRLRLDEDHPQAIDIDNLKSQL